MKHQDSNGENLPFEQTDAALTAGHQCSEPMLEELQHTLKGSMSFFRVELGYWRWGWWCCVMVVALNLDLKKLRPESSGRCETCIKSIKLSINEGLMVFIDPSHLRSKFP